MADQYTPLEDLLDAMYASGRDELAHPGVVQGWDDFMQRRGYLHAISDVGEMIKRLRRPVADTHGEITGILPEGET